MLSDQLVYSKLEQPVSKDYSALRLEGIAQIQALAKEVWTDHNTHDPGITMLEALAYALTDVGNRLHQPIEDILSTSGDLRSQFPDPTSVLPVRAWTVEDLRRRLMDLPQVRNTWIQFVDQVEPILYFNPAPPIDPFPSLAPFHQLVQGGDAVGIKGLYDVLLEFENPADLQEADTIVDINGSVIRRENVAFSYLDDEGALQNDSLIVDFTFPYWDESRVSLWANILTISSLDDPDGGPNLVLQALPEALAGNDYLLRALVSHNLGSPDEISVLVKIYSELEVAGNRRVAAEAAILAELEAISLWERYNRMVFTAHQALRATQDACEQNRNLCEDMYRYRAVRVQEIAVNASIEVVGGADIEALLAEAFWRVTQFLDRPPLFSPFSQAINAENASGELLLEGPLLESGWLDTDLLAENDQHQSRNALYVSDFGALLLEPIGSDATEQIQAIRGLSISNFVRNRLVTAQARDCLRLINPGVYQPRFSITKSVISVYRDGQRVMVDLGEVVDLVEGFRLEANLQARFGSPEIPLPEGNEIDLSSYLPLGEDLPLTYGLGEAGLPANASTQRHAQKNQLQAYLYPFEQILADSLAQLNNLPAVFSPEAGERPTYFSQNLYNLPSSQEVLIGAGESNADWEAFIADEGNSYVVAQREAGETADIQLTRRHQLLDHLLARQGENLLAYSLQRLTQATRDLTGAEAATARLQTRIELRDEKAAFLKAIPHLQAVRGLGFDRGYSQRLTHIQTSNAGNPEIAQGWELRTYFGRLMMRQEGTASNAELAMLHARETLPYASNRNYYHILPSGSRFRFELTDNTIPGTGNVRGESVRTYTTQAAAEREITEIIDLMRGAWHTYNRSGMSQKLRYLIGLKSIQRRSLSAPFDQYLRIRLVGGGTASRYDVLDEGGRLMFYCPINFPDNETLLEHVYSLVAASMGPDPFRAVPEGNRFRFNLVDGDGTVMLIRPGTETNAEDTLAWGPVLAMHVYHAFSREGFHVIEHMLLRPQSETSAEFLSIYDDELNPVADPYTARVTVVFPSGYMRDFADPTSEPQEDLAPALYRDPEFRRYVEKTVKQLLPAHIYPHILWLDRDNNPTPDLNAPKSLNGLEAAWRSFIEAEMTHDFDPSLHVQATDQINRILSLALNPALIEALNNV